MAFLVIIGFLGAIVFGIMAIVSAIRKTGKGRRFGGYAAVLFIIFIVGVWFTPVEEETSSEPKKEKVEQMEINVEHVVTISTLDKEAKISGTVKNIDKLKINGEDTVIKDDSFTKVVPVSDEQKSIEIIGLTDSKEETKTLVNIERKAPVVKLNITSKEESKNKLYDLTGETEQSANVKLYKDSKEVAKVVADKDGKFTFSKLDTKKSGEYKYEVEASKDGYESTKQKHSVFRSLSKEEELQEVKESAITIDYKQLEKNKNKHVGEYAKFKGQIIQILEDGDYTVMRIAVAQNSWGWDSNAILYVEYDGTTEFVQDDVVTVYGRMMGEHSYESQAGWNISVPSLLAEIIE